MIKPKKSLGQNFLKDKNIIKKIVNLTTIYNENIGNNPYFIYETSRSSDGAVMLNTYDYNQDKSTIELGKSIEIDKS